MAAENAGRAALLQSRCANTLYLHSKAIMRAKRSVPLPTVPSSLSELCACGHARVQAAGYRLRQQRGNE